MKHINRLFPATAALLTLLSMTACGASSDAVQESAAEPAKTSAASKETAAFHPASLPSIMLTSENLHEGVWDAEISNTKQGANRSPQLAWEPVSDAAGYVIMMADSTAGTWLQFVDRDHDGRLDTGEPVLQSGAVADARHIAILGNRPMRQPIVFMPQGQAEQASGAFAAGTLRICVRDAIQPNAVDLILSRSGRVRAESRDLSGDCPFP